MNKQTKIESQYIYRERYRKPFSGVEQKENI